MNIEEATRLERHILRVKPAYKPQARKIGSGEWIVKLANGTMIWSAEDYENVTKLLVKQKQQEQP